MKKKILFFIDDLGGGGAEKVLCDVISNLDKEQFDVTVMTYFDRGIYIDEIKNNAKYRTCFKTLTPGTNIFKKIYNVFLLEYFRNYTKKLPMKYFYMTKVRGKYDIEVAFLEGISTKIISNSTNNKSKKIAWVHADLLKNNWALRYYQNFEEQKEAYNKFNKIICVSNIAKHSFSSKFGISHNLHTQYNPLNEKVIETRSQELISDLKITSKFKIVTVGRLDIQKGYDRLLEAHKQLIEEGFNYELWIIGDGPKRNEIEEFILKNMLSDSIKLLGFKENPYKYIKQGDLYICSSRNEGYPLVVGEALILGIPVVSTNCTGPTEMLNFGEYGMLVDNSSEGIYTGLKKILQDTKLHQYYKQKALERGSQFKISEKMVEIENLINNN